MQVKGFYIFKKPAPTAFLYFQQILFMTFAYLNVKVFQIRSILHYL